MAQRVPSLVNITAQKIIEVALSTGQKLDYIKLLGRFAHMCIFATVVQSIVFRVKIGRKIAETIELLHILNSQKHFNNEMRYLHSFAQNSILLDGSNIRIDGLTLQKFCKQDRGLRTLNHAYLASWALMDNSWDKFE